LKLFGGVAPADWLIVGLGNPGSRYEGTPHNVGGEVARALGERWNLGRPRKKFNALLSEGRTMPGGPRVAVLLPQTYMNESGKAAGPARGAFKVDLDHVIAIQDEIDLPFGEIRTKLGGGLAGHNGLRSLKSGFGSPEFVRVRVGVGRPDTSDPEIVSGHVLGKWREPRQDVDALIARAADAVEALVEGRAAP
jgi:PTH1 family peptidyl-tRNA hydrolase